MRKTYAEKIGDFFGNLFLVTAFYGIYTLVDIASKYTGIKDLPLSAIDIYNTIQPYLGQMLR